MEQKRLTKVIQFVDEGTKRRIEKGYYGAEIDWNPRKEISLYTPSEIEELKQLGAHFEQNPSLTNDGVSTFVEIDGQSHEYSCVEMYAPDFMSNKQMVLARVLQKLGIHEYFIKSSFHMEGSVGSEGDIKGGAKANAPVDGSCSIELSSNKNSGLSSEASNVKAVYNKLKGSSPTQKDWEEAKELAEKADLYSDIADIIEMRKPGSNELLSMVDHRRIDGQIKVNLSFASSLTVLKCFQEGSFSGKSTFNASVKGYYDTLVFYNFDPNTDSLEYKEFVRAELENIK